MEDKLSERIYIDGEAEGLIVKLFKQYRLIIITCIILSVLSLTVAITQMMRYSNKVAMANWRNFYLVRGFYFVTILDVVLTIVQIQFFYRSWRLQQRALFISNQYLFNRGLALARKGNFYAIVVIIINILNLSAYLLQKAF